MYHMEGNKAGQQARTIKMFNIKLVNKAGKVVFSDLFFASCDLDASMQALESASLKGIDTKELRVVRG